MGQINEVDDFTTPVYSLELADRVAGAPDGISNLQAKQLAARTYYLKMRLEVGHNEDGTFRIDVLRAILDAIYAAKIHEHNELYSRLDHLHQGIYSEVSHNHDARYAFSVHNHDLRYAYTIHIHDTRYAALVHKHNDLYYLKAEITALLSYYYTRDDINQMFLDYYTKPDIEQKLSAYWTGEVTQGKLDAYTLTDKDLQKQINDEVQSRTDADTNETKARSDKDYVLDQQIKDETQARNDGDAALNQKIVDETQDRTQSEAVIGSRIDNEIQDRINGDDNLGLRIDNEEQSRISSDDNINLRVDALRDNLNNETENRKSGDIPRGTRMLFQQAAAPTGWTKEMGWAYDNAALRIVTSSVSTGGSEGFSTRFNAWVSFNSSGAGTTGGTTISVDQLPPHHHINYGNNINPGGGEMDGESITDSSGRQQYNSGDTGGGQAHYHSTPDHQHDVNFNLKYVDFIIAIKD